MIGFVSLHCLSINPFIHISTPIVYMGQKATKFLLRTHRDFLYYCRTGYVVSTIIYSKYCIYIVIRT